MSKRMMWSIVAVLLLVLTTVTVARAQDGLGSNTQPFSFGPDQTIIGRSVGMNAKPV